MHHRPQNFGRRTHPRPQPRKHQQPKAVALPELIQAQVQPRPVCFQVCCGHCSLTAVLRCCPLGETLPAASQFVSPTGSAALLQAMKTVHHMPQNFGRKTHPRVQPQRHRRPKAVALHEPTKAQAQPRPVGLAWLAAAVVLMAKTAKLGWGRYYWDGALATPAAEGRRAARALNLPPSWNFLAGGSPPPLLRG